MISTQRSFVKNNLVALFGQDSKVYNNLKDKLSEINSNNKELLLEEFVNNYNNNANLKDNSAYIISSYLGNFFSKNNLYKFLQKIKAIEKNFDSDLREEINHLLFEIVNTHYQGSTVITLRYPEDKK